MDTVNGTRPHLYLPDPKILVTGGPRTFAFSATIDGLWPTDSVVEYKWDFGNGVFKYGPTQTFTYKVVSPENVIRLVVTSATGLQGHCFTVVNLQPAVGHASPLLCFPYQGS